MAVKGDYSIAVPSGTKPLQTVDDDMRANAEAIQLSINEEHDFPSAGGAGTQTGRHKFFIGNLAARNAITEWVDGSVAFLTDADPLDADALTLCLHNTGHPDADVNDWVTLLRINPNRPSEISGAQWGTYETLTVTAGDIDWDWETSNAYEVNLTAATQRLRWPTGANVIVDGKYAVRTLLVRQDGAGGRLLTFETGVGFRSGYQSAPMPIASGSNEESIVTFTLIPGPLIVVSVYPGLQAI